MPSVFSPTVRLAPCNDAGDGREPPVRQQSTMDTHSTGLRSKETSETASIIITTNYGVLMLPLLSSHIFFFSPVLRRRQAGQSGAASRAIRFDGRTDRTALTIVPRSFAFVGWPPTKTIKEIQGPTQSFIPARVWRIGIQEVKNLKFHPPPLPPT